MMQITKFNQMHENISLESANRLLITGYVKSPHTNFLSFIVIEESTLILLCAIFGGQEVDRKLRSGFPVEKLIQDMQPFQYTMAQFPIDDLVSLSWNDHSSEVTFAFVKDSRIKRYKVFINSDESRTNLLYILQSHFRDPFKYLQKSAGVFRVAWSFFLGTLFSIAAFIWFCFYWDPADFQKGDRGDWLFLFFGQTGCAIIAAGFIIGTVYYAWKAIQQRSKIHYCRVQNDKRD